MEIKWIQFFGPKSQEMNWFGLSCSLWICRWRFGGKRMINEDTQDVIELFSSNDVKENV